MGFNSGFKGLKMLLDTNARLKTSKHAIRLKCVYLILQQNSIKRNRLDLLSWTGGSNRSGNVTVQGITNSLIQKSTSCIGNCSQCGLPGYGTDYSGVWVQAFRRSTHPEFDVHDARKRTHPPTKLHGANLHRCKKSHILCVNLYFQLLRTFLGGSRFIKCTYPKIWGMNSRTGYSTRDCISDTGRSVGYSYNLHEP